MPQRTFATGQDWSVQTTGKGGSSAAKIAQSMTTQKRFGAGGNSSATTIAGMSAKKLEEADDVGTIQRVDKSLSKAIMQARTAQKLSQKDLATAINAKPQIIAEYENGKAIPDPGVISKLERKLKTKLPRPGKKSKVPAKEGAGKSQQKSTLTRGGPPKRR